MPPWRRRRRIPGASAGRCSHGWPESGAIAARARHRPRSAWPRSCGAPPAWARPPENRGSRCAVRRCLRFQRTPALTFRRGIRRIRPLSTPSRSGGERAARVPTRRRCWPSARPAGLDIGRSRRRGAPSPRPWSVGPDLSSPIPATARFGPRFSARRLLRSCRPREVVELTGIEFDHAVHLVVGHLLQRLRRALSALWPERVRVRVVALPGDLVDADHVAHLHAEVILDKAAVNVLLEQVARRVILVDVVVEAVLSPHAVATLQDVRDPTDAALGQADLELRVAVQGV